jgi:broad specificity phosphatase PhoE
MKIYLIRHGESMDDIEDCYGGIADFPLTEFGRCAAQLLANKLTYSKIEVFYTSPYKRAHETACLMSKVIGCTTKVMSSLRERNSFGVISGVNRAKAKDIFAHILCDLRYGPGDYYAGEPIAGDEPVSVFDSRIQEAFNEIIVQSQDREVIGIVTHGNVTRSLYRNLLRISGKVHLDFLALTVLNHDPEKILIERSEGVVVRPDWEIA